MTGTTMHLVWALIVFVGGHFLLSHPLRAPLVGLLGETGFRGLYSLIALASLIWVAFAYRAAPVTVLWPHAEALRWPVHGVMLLAAVLFAGSFAGNPYVKMMTTGLQSTPQPSGVYAITRHPMMWAFGLWALAHMATSGDVPTVLLGAGIALLALLGAALQDVKLAARLGALWWDFQAHTSYFPFLAIAQGKTPLKAVGLFPLLAGAALYLALVYAHPWIAGVSALAH